MSSKAPQTSPADATCRAWGPTSVPLAWAELGAQSRAAQAAPSPTPPHRRGAASLPSPQKCPPLPSKPLCLPLPSRTGEASTRRPAARRSAGCLRGSASHFPGSASRFPGFTWQQPTFACAEPSSGLLAAALPNPACRFPQGGGIDWLQPEWAWLSAAWTELQPSVTPLVKST